MQLVRIYFSKTDNAKFISHLDLVRCFTRAIRRSNLDIWYTEGFNSRPYLLFALPLSLGIESIYEVLDIRLNETYDLSLIPELLNRYLPNGIEVLRCSEAILKHSEIGMAQYTINLFSSLENFKSVETLLKNRIIEADEIMVEKKSKKGISIVDVRSQIREISYALCDSTLQINATLDAGVSKNLNPIIIVNLIVENCNIDFDYSITRSSIITKDNNEF